ncbi:MAG: hypoxanthine phosphoribosyltransferase [Gemmatimonadota bacterium]
MSEAGPRTPSETPVGKVVYDEEAIRRRVAGLAREIEAVYTATDRLLLLGVLKGAVIFMSDLARALTIPVQIDFMSVSSYGDGLVSSGMVRIEHDARMSVEGRNVLLVEDIVDSGTTLDRVVAHLREQGAATVETCAFLHKRIAESDHEPRFVGFDAPNVFLVGYGLDRAEDFRHLPYIASL